jgi:hypothetical protein
MTTPPPREEFREKADCPNCGKNPCFRLKVIKTIESMESHPHVKVEIAERLVTEAYNQGREDERKRAEAYRQLAIREHAKTKMAAYGKAGIDAAAFVGMPPEFVVDVEWIDAEAEKILTTKPTTGEKG